MAAVRRVGIRDLRDHATQVLASVREENARYVITVRGRPVAAIVALPADVPASATDDELDLVVDRALSVAEFEAELDALRREIDANWASQLSAVAIIEDHRR